MKAFLEVNGSPAKFCKKTGLITVNGDAVQTSELVTLCAWCSNDLTKPMMDAGYEKISHGLCESCDRLANDEDK